MFRPNDHVLDHVDDYLHKVLTSADASYVERHCNTCRICQVALEEARRRFAAFETVPPTEAPQPLIQATLERIDRYERGWPRLRRRLLLGVGLPLAAAVLILSMLHLYYANLTASPTDLVVLGQNRLLAGSPGSLRVRLQNHISGAALAGVPVTIDLQRKMPKEVVQLVRFQTDSQGTGTPRFQLPDWEDGSYELRVTARQGWTNEVITQTVQLHRSWKLMLSSDKPVYQPGQTIHLRSLALHRPDLKPVAGHAVTFSITDPKGNVIFKRQDVTSKFGIAACDCPLAAEIIEGAYAVQCQVGDTESKQTVDVQKYVLPKFKIAVELDQPFYQPGQTVHGKLHADYFFGKPVADGAVAVEIKTTDVGPRMLHKLEARTDAKGEASFEYRLPETFTGREQDSGDARIAVEATLTDSAGQKQARAVSRIVTANPLHVEVIPEAGNLVAGVPNTIYFYVSYADGRPARARLAVTGVDREVVSSDLGVASVEVTPDADGLNWTVRATDEQGRSGRRQVQLACGQINQDFLVRTDKAVYTSGDTVHLTALGGGQESIFIDLIKDGQTILTETVALADGHGTYDFDVPPELFGTVQLCAYRFGPQGLPVRKTRVLYVRQTRQLDIKAALDHAEYRPGGKAKVQFTLTDAQGKPAPGALSLAGVDEAVYSVMEQAPWLEKTFYTLERELLEPVYAIYPWSPDAEGKLPPEERNRFEQTLFARTAQTATGANVTSVVNGPGGRAVTQTHADVGPHSLAVASFPAKEQEIQATRTGGLKRVVLAWEWLSVLTFIGLVIGGFIALWHYSRWLFVMLGVAAGALLCVYSVSILGTSANGTFTRVGFAVDLSRSMSGDKAPQNASRTFRESQDESPNPEMPVQGQEGVPPSPVRVREWFPETLLWRPELVTDDQGHASLDLDLADAITTWRLTASAVTADGRLGADQSSLRVFQPFFVDLNLPVALTRGDEVSVSVVVYNYLQKPQTVELTLDNAPWFERQGDAVQKIELAAGEVRSTAYRLKVRTVGNHTLQVTARAGDVADALKRTIDVVPDGRRVEQVFNGSLHRPAELTLTLPDEFIEGSPKAILKLYPSNFSQLVEGLDAIFRMPSGCFEQTSSTTYPNVLALDYLRRANKSVPEVEVKARQYIHLGYQRLLGFEVNGGGFDWFGRPPANRTLTAYGLMEFTDMARVHDVDPALIQRTRQWLLSQRQRDGSWPEEGHVMHEDPTHGRGGADLGRYATTAYLAWAVFDGQASDPQARPTLDYLLSRKPETLTAPHVLALTCNALLALGAEKEAGPYLDRLESLKQTGKDGKLVWWDLPALAQTTFYGGGRSGSIETTALASLALLRAARSPATVNGALAWLVEQKDASGTWHSTQATVLALKALLAGTNKALGKEQERRIEIAWGKDGKREVVIPADQGDVMQQIDLSEVLGAGSTRVTLTERGDAATGYQLAFRYHAPGERQDKAEAPLAITIDYDRAELAVGDTVTATAKIVNRMNQTAPMVVLDLPIPGGFTMVAEDLAKLVDGKTIAKYQVNARTAVVYLRGLEPGKALELRYHLRATMPVKVTVPAGRAYQYYDPDKEGRSSPASLKVVQRP
jgi:alpha-2-macroglobulin-like protein